MNGHLVTHRARVTTLMVGDQYKEVPGSSTGARQARRGSCN